MKTRRTVLLLFLSAAASGCFSLSAPLRDTSSPAASPASIQPREAQAAERTEAPTPEVSGPLDVGAAIALAWHYHPALAAARARVEAASGRKLQAGLYPNPVFSARMESAPFSGKSTGDAEYPVGFSQRILLGGRLGAGVKVAEAERQRLFYDFEQRRRDVEKKVRGAFAAALFAQQALLVETQVLQAAQEVARIARERVDSGDAAADEAARAELEAARSKIARSRAELERQKALIELRTAMGDEAPPLPELGGDLEAVLSLPELGELLERMSESPILRAHSAAVAQSAARILRAEAERIPDIDVGLFYRRLEETETDAFDVGFAIQLPIFNRNQGTLQAARAELLEARANQRQVEASLVSRIRTSYWKLKHALETVRLFREELSPRSQTVVEAAEERYRAGDTSLAELIPIRRDSREVEMGYLISLRRVATEWAELRSLVSITR